MPSLSRTILVVNAGSSSIKFQLFTSDGDALAMQLKGQLDGIGTHPKLRVRKASGETLIDSAYPAERIADVEDAQALLGTWLAEEAGITPMAVGHRVVHGGPDHAEPVLIDDTVLARLEELVPLAPLHQPNNPAPIRSLRKRRPDLPQVACFDTGFHRGHPELADRFAIPDALHAEGVRRYGFHGLSYEYIASRLPEISPKLAQGRVVVAHLGSGCSMCALQAGRSIDSTMGFTALDGLPMGTRSGQIDPGVLLYLISEKGFDTARLERFLYHECGLKGLSGISNDMRDLEASSDPRAKLAIDYFVYRIVRELGGLAGVLGGLDGIVFTAGIGENSARVRGEVGTRLRWLGVDLDEEANRKGAAVISRPGSRVAVHVVPTNEELMIARHTLRLVSGR